MKKINKNKINDYQYISLNNTKKYFYTRDLGCASSLISYGFEFISFDKTKSQKVQFIFLRKAGIEKIINAYRTNNLKVEARTFFSNIEILENLICSK